MPATLPHNGRPYMISACATVAADPQHVYGILADYQEGHARILPPQFDGLTVEKGGVGEGTIIRFSMRLLGRKQSFRAAITEPEPGRVLMETDLDTNGAVTTFTVDPAGPEGSNVCISTTLKTRSGIAGAIERRLSTWALRPIYVRELEILAAVAATAQAGVPTVRR